ncbi:hypothetical protein EJ03DRAFT_187168 [Teratosphaeria nubilosa]|uniref:Uncharacterized protein n=1 Tax=Teratosphaeria nubilosa TaxID=161662 RepID=A0A6G1LI18_9PEZI|nr:hypothetical protein EJ03DRAFT_187168 [Teratosphaeria nubilosa]
MIIGPALALQSGHTQSLASLSAGRDQTLLLRRYYYIRQQHSVALCSPASAEIINLVDFVRMGFVLCPGACGCGVRSLSSTRGQLGKMFCSLAAGGWLFFDLVSGRICHCGDCFCTCLVVVDVEGATCESLIAPSVCSLGDTCYVCHGISWIGFWLSLLVDRGGILGN